jgi:hypothetical protein
LTFIGKWLAFSLLLTACVTNAAAETVRAKNYKSFWLWAGVKPQAVLKTADEIYVLAGEVTNDEAPFIKSQRAATPQIESSKVWIVYRAQTLNWTPEIRAAVMRRMDEWAQAGNDLAGLQIDFDAGTKNLAGYAAFLRSIRAELPTSYRLSVTGLLDWSANGDPAGLRAVADVVDEVILQIYQGRKVIPGYQSYFANIDRINMPFRIGLLEGGEWIAPAKLEQHAQFRGYVVFLLNPAK